MLCTAHCQVLRLGVRTSDADVRVQKEKGTNLVRASPRINRLVVDRVNMQDTTEEISMGTTKLCT